MLIRYLPSLQKHATLLYRETGGATAVEYGLLAGLAALALLGGFGALADLVHLIFDFIVDETTNVADSVN